MKRVSAVFVVVGLIGSLLMVPAAVASEKQAGEAVEQKVSVAINGYCPVCITKGKYVKGLTKFSTEYKGKIYFFPGFDQQKAFLNDPEAYLEDLEKKYQDLKAEHAEKGSPKGSH